MRNKKLQRKLRISLPTQVTDAAMKPESYHQYTQSFKFENFRRTVLDGEEQQQKKKVRESLPQNEENEKMVLRDFQCTTEEMEDLIKKSKSVLVEINQGNIRKGRNTPFSREIASTLPTASTGLSTFARAKNSSKKESNLDFNATEQNESVQKRGEPISLFTSGKSVFKGKRTNSNQFVGTSSIKKFKDMIDLERKQNQTPPIQQELRTPLIRVSSESKFYCNETYHNGKQVTEFNSEDENSKAHKPQIFLDVPPSREMESSKEAKKRKIALIYENSAIRGIQKLNRKKLPQVKNELREMKFRQTPELSCNGSSRSQSPSIQLLHPVNRNYKRIDYLRASIGNCEHKNESFLSSISFKSPLKYRANQSIGGNQTYEKSASRSNRLIIKKAQINSKRQKLINLYRGDQPRSRNEQVAEVESVCLSSKLKGKPLLQIYQDQDINRNTPKQLNLDLPMTPKESAKRNESRAESDFSLKNQSINETNGPYEGEISSSQSESFSILKPAITAFQNKPENSRNNTKKMSQFKKSGHSRQRALLEDDFKKISSSFMYPSSRSRAAPELGSKSTDIGGRQRNRFEEPETLNFPRIQLIPGASSNRQMEQIENISGDKKEGEQQEMEDYEIGTFRITDTTPSVLKIRKHSHISEGGYTEETEGNREQITKIGQNYSEGDRIEEGKQEEAKNQGEGVQKLQNLDTEDISIKAMRNEEEMEESLKNDSFYFSNRNQEAFSSQNERSEKKESGNSLWDANNLLDEEELPAEEEAPPHNLSSFMIMEMLKKNKEKQKRHKLIRNISNADTEEFRSHRSISEIFEAAQEEEDGFLCDDSDAFVRRFNTTGGELSQAIEDLALSSNFMSSK